MPTLRHCCAPGSSASTAATPSMRRPERPPYRRCALQRSPAPPTYYARLFGADPALQGTRESYAMKENTLPDAGRRDKMTGFFFWTALGGVHRAPGYPRHLHQQLAARAVDRQQAHARERAVVGHQRRGHDGPALASSSGRGHSCAGMTRRIPCRRRRIRCRACRSRRRSAASASTCSWWWRCSAFRCCSAASPRHYTVEGQTFYGIEVSQWFP
jgi:nitric oxide reductase subunit B